MAMMMQAIRCHAFGAVLKVKEEEAAGVSSTTTTNNQNQQQQRPRQKPKFIPRKQSLKLTDILSLDTIPLPSSSTHDDTLLKPNQILIKTMYAGIQYPDYLQTQGLYQVKPKLPYIPGMDMTGIVIKIGSNVSTKTFNVGDRVMAYLIQDGGTGGLADYVLVEQQFVFRIPHTIKNLATVSNIGRNYFAAYHSIKTLGGINPNSVILVDGASGGVGMATIELAKAIGCKCIIAGVSSEDKMKYPYSVGADVVFTYGRTKQTYKNFKQHVLQYCKTTLGNPNGVDIIIDMVNGQLFENALVGCIKPMGKICLVGFTAGQQQLIKPGIILVKEIQIIGSLWGRYALIDNPKQHRFNVYEILNYIANGKIKPRVDRIYHKSNFIKAFELYHFNNGRGNTVISFINENYNNNENDNN